MWTMKRYILLLSDIMIQFSDLRGCSSSILLGYDLNFQAPLNH